MDDFLFQDEIEDQPQESAEQLFWPVLIVDDEPDIHTVTKLALSSFEFDGRRLQFSSAFSKAEAQEILSQEHDFAVVWIDVVMESHNAGLELVQFIREEQQNQLSRLILRTGQPGEAPEESAIRDYDINDYKNKTELTELKLKTVMYSAMRSYRDLLKIEHHKQGLESIVQATGNLLSCSDIRSFGNIVLAQIASILGLKHSKIICCLAFGEDNESLQLEILASQHTDTREGESIPEDIYLLFKQALNKKASLREGQHYIGYFVDDNKAINLMYVSSLQQLSEQEHEFLEVFNKNMSLVFSNLRMKNLIRESQKELSYILGEAVEKRSKETGSHVKRVAEFSYLLGQLSGLGEYECEKLRMASPLHDVGKIAIPDSILNKPAKLEPSEWSVMQTHAQQGWDILSQSSNEILQAGALISLQHHERFDGRGYPAGLKGEEISAYGRISAIADVFDALASERCYKPAWPIEKVVALLESEAGGQFDPMLVRLLVDNLPQFMAIRDTYPDETG